MPERLGWQYTWSERLLALRPLGFAVLFMGVIGGGVLTVYERQHAIRDREAAQERDRINDRVQYNGQLIAELEDVARRAIEGHKTISARLDRMEKVLGEVRDAVAREGSP